MDEQDLNELRSIDELESYRKDIVAEIAGLEDEYRGLPYPDDVREEYARHRETNDELGKRLAELRAREKYQREQLEEGRVEKPVDFDRFARDASSTKQESIWDERSMPNPLTDPERAKSE